MKKIVVFILALCSAPLFSQIDPRGIDTVVFKSMEDSIAVRLLEYRKVRGLKEQKYEDQYNYLIREWAKDFIENRNLSLKFTLNEEDSACPHFDFNKRIKGPIYKYNHFNYIAEIVAFSSYKKDFNKLDYETVIVGFDGSPRHKEIMVNDSKYRYFCLGYYYSEKNRAMSCYIVFFSNWVKDKNGKWVED